MTQKNSKQRLFEVMQRVAPNFEGNALSEEIPNNIPAEETNLNEASSYSPIHLYVYFAFNFPSDFIEKVWANNNLMEHIKSKFDGYYNKYGADAVMNRFYVELDRENQQILEDWILKNYSG